jgi:aspartyl protease family protein
MIDEVTRFGNRMIIIFWFALFGLLWFLFDGVIADRENPNRHIAVGRASTNGELVLQRNAWGHYVAPGAINGHPVTFLLDTGATRVAVPAHLTYRLQLQPGAHRQVSTANGVVNVRATRIDTLELGPFEFHDLTGDLNPGMEDDEVLLGMSALKHLEFTQRADSLILRIPATQ